MQAFQAGFAKKKITPPLGTLLFGYPRDRAATRVLDDLYVGALAMKQGDKSALLVGVDVCTLIEEVCDVIRASIEKVAPVKKEDIIVFAIHTHSGPITNDSPGWGYADASFLNDILYPQCVEAAKAAFDDLKDAEMAVASVESRAGMNRRQIKDGKVILGQNPDGPFDPNMTVARFRALDGTPIGSFVHYPCHPTTAGSNFSITRDWPGYVIDRIEEISGAGCLYMNGAEGDVGPRLANGQTTGDESNIAETGCIAREDAQRAYEAANQFYVPELKTLTGDVLIPFNPAPTLEEVQAQLDALPEVLVDVDIRVDAQLRNMKQMLLDGVEFPTGQYLHQTVLSLGDFALVPGPFETFTNIALAIKDGSPFARTLYVGLGNGCLGYLPTLDQIPYGGYEVDSFHSTGITGFVDNTCELFAEGNIQLLKQLKNS